jgi:thiaminase (transcriptional activator TenA)
MVVNLKHPDYRPDRKESEAPMAFSDVLWRENSGLYHKIVEMPFNAELRDGTLSPAAFRHYIIQDAHYLEGFARALALAAAKARSADQIAILANSAAGAIHVERGLHEGFFKTFGVTASDFKAVERSPVCDHYVSNLVKVAATEDFPIIVSALLPCFWIYMKVGKHIQRSSSPQNPYQAWIDTYAGAEFETAVRQMIALLDELAASSSESTCIAMQRTFRHCTLLEWMFWDSAYHQRGWPV